MSVLVEALTVIVRRLTLDTTWPGGTAAYLAAAVREDSPARLTSADDHLTGVSFLSSDDCHAWIERLNRHVLNDCAADIVCIDEHHGPTTPCDWIEWRRHPEGFTYAWLAGTDPGDVVAPSIRRPPRVATRSVVRDDKDRMIQLATEDGLEYWLDLDTGEQIVGLANQSGTPERLLRRKVEPLMPIVLTALGRLEWTPESQGDDMLTIRIAGPRFVFTMFSSSTTRRGRSCARAFCRLSSTLSDA